VFLCSAEFEAKYQEMYQQLGAGGCGAVFAGYRREDGLPVSVTHTHIKSNTHTHTFNEIHAHTLDMFRES